jgi:drug/metabolite transporter (DMT)-like permease
MTTELKGLTLAIISAVLYGSLPLFGLQITDAGLSNEAMLFWRFFSSFLLLAVLFPSSVFLLKQTAITGFLLAVFGYVISSFFFFECTGYIGTGIAMTVFFIYPIFLALMNYFILKETLPTPQKIGMALAFCALLFLTDFKFDIKGDVFIGFAYGIFGGMGYALYIFCTRSTGLKAITLTAWVCLGAAVFFAVHSVFNNAFVFPPMRAGLSLAAISILCTILPIIFFIKAVNLIGSIKASLVSILEPATTISLGMIFLGERITWCQGVGLVFMIVSLIAIECNHLFRRRDHASTP